MTSRPGARRRVALVHDWLTGMRGGERVLERVARFFPDADLHTLVWTPGAVSRELERHRIRTSFLNRFPAADTHYRWFLPLFPAAIESLDLSGYDAVVSTSHAVAKGVIDAPRRAAREHRVHAHALRLGPAGQYFPPGRFQWPASAYVEYVCARLRRWDRATASRPTTIVAISRYVGSHPAALGRESTVVFPHVDVERFTPGMGERSYYLLAGAFAPYKRLDLALQAFRGLDLPLVVVGGGQEESRLHAMAPRGTEFRSGVSDEELARIYAGAKALLFPGEEDFGIMPLEAMASGTPVIAFGRGGAVETVGRGASDEALATVEAGGIARVPGGMLFGTQTASAVASAVRAFERETFDPLELARLAQPFSGERFDAEMRAVFEEAGILEAGA
jgi:glycosyltransferase involved in cell wall biosynthesis